ncbi:MAG: hypothetical protein GF409_02560 [Candidatus Omnitrophica bacterium]|nr:hypothetical protein [Candidatus Omnitrophota bacterium]
MKEIIISVVIGVSVVTASLVIGINLPGRYRVVINSTFGAVKYDSVTGRTWRLGKTQIVEIKDYGRVFEEPESGGD